MVAIKSGKYEKFWELSVIERAWLIAAVETQETLQQVVDYVAKLETDE